MAANGRLLLGSYPTQNRTGYIAATRIDTCARYSGKGWEGDGRLPRASGR